MLEQKKKYGCLSEDTTILCGEVWKSYKDVRVGDNVMGFDMDTGEFKPEVVEEVIIYAYDDDAYKVLGEGIDAVFSVGHRCIVAGDDSNPRFVMAEDLEEEVIVPIVTFMPDQEEFFFPEYVMATVGKFRFTGIVWCVKVPSGAFVAKRKDMAFVTGNSLG